MQATLDRLRERRAQGDEGGFTLIELLIVIVILGILAAIVVFAVQNLTGQSQTAACQSQYKTLETAQEAYKAQIGSYAKTFGTGTTGLQGSSTGLDGTTDGPWLKDAPPTDTSAPYYFTIDTASGKVGNIMVGANNGTTPYAPADGDGNCQNA
jgi:general secretion pathway protein G